MSEEAKTGHWEDLEVANTGTLETFSQIINRIEMVEYDLGRIKAKLAMVDGYKIDNALRVLSLCEKVATDWEDYREKTETALDYGQEVHNNAGYMMDDSYQLREDDLGVTIKALRSALGGNTGEDNGNNTR